MNGEFPAIPERGAEVREPLEHAVGGRWHDTAAPRTGRRDPGADTKPVAPNPEAGRQAALLRVPGPRPLALRAQGTGTDGRVCRFG